MSLESPLLRSFGSCNGSLQSQHPANDSFYLIYIFTFVRKSEPNMISYQHGVSKTKTLCSFVLIFLSNWSNLRSRSLTIIVAVMCSTRVSMSFGSPNFFPWTTFGNDDILIRAVIEPESSRTLKNVLSCMIPIVFAMSIVAGVSCLTFTILSIFGTSAEQFST